MFTRTLTGDFKLLVNDSLEIGTLECRISPSLYREEAGVFVESKTDNLMFKAFLSVRDEAGFNSSSNAIDTHYSRKGRI